MAKRQVTRKKVTAKQPTMSKALRDHIASEAQVKEIGKIIGQMHRDHLAGRYESQTKKRKLPKDLQDYLDKQERERQRRSYTINAA